MCQFLIQKLQIDEDEDVVIQKLSAPQNAIPKSPVPDNTILEHDESLSSNPKKINEGEPTGKGVTNFYINLNDIRDILDPTCQLNIGVAAAIWRRIFEAFPSDTIQFLNPLYCYTDIVETGRKTGGSEGDGYDLKCNREVLEDIRSGERVLIDKTGGLRIVIHQDRITIHALFYK